MLVIVVAVVVVAAAVAEMVVKALLLRVLKLVSPCHLCWPQSMTQAHKHFQEVHLFDHPETDRVFVLQACR